MKKSKHYLTFLMALLLLQPIPVYADDETAETVLRQPRQAMMPYEIATLSVHYGCDFSGTVFTVCRTQEEGEFPYYIFAAEFAEPTELQFPLWEGEYKLILEIPSDFEQPLRQEFSFTIDDPDDAGELFTSVEQHFYLQCVPEESEHSVSVSEKMVQEKVQIQKTSVHIARRAFSPGDLDGDGDVNAVDAALLLTDAAKIGSGETSDFSSLQRWEADADRDYAVNAADAAIILQYAAASAAGSFSGDFYSYQMR